MTDIINQLKSAYAENPAKALNLLPELFKQADDGLINVLPCKVGDTIFIPRCDDIQKINVEGFEILKDGIPRPGYFVCGEGLCSYHPDEYELTPESAEQALKEREKQ